MKVLVVGATGTVGRAVVQALKAHGTSVIAASRTPEVHVFPQGVSGVRFDYDDDESVATAMAGADRCFVVAPPGLRDQARRWANTFAAAARAGVQHAVVMTAMGATEDTPHGQGEARLRESGLPWTVLRPRFFAQNFITYSGESIRRDHAFYYPAGAGRTAYIDVRDIAEVAATVLANPSVHIGKGYDLTGPAELSMHDVAASLSAAVGRPIQYVDPGGEGYKRALLDSGAPADIATMFTHLYDVVVRQGWAGGTTEDVAQVLGRPATAFDDFVRAHVDAWR